MSISLYMELKARQLLGDLAISNPAASGDLQVAAGNLGMKEL
jgi:hypothetical protein